MITVDSIPHVEIPVQEIILTLEDVRSAKNIWIGKDIKITDDALGYALVNKIPIHKDALKGIDKDDIIDKYNKSLVSAERVKKLEKVLGINIEELIQLIK